MKERTLKVGDLVSVLYISSEENIHEIYKIKDKDVIFKDNKTTSIEIEGYYPIKVAIDFQKEVTMREINIIERKLKELYNNMLKYTKLEEKYINE
ncbi:unnamed protein product [marine sediment metagenome]|uniref:Uncharacterized protein n=1 Tax=marine sediment metagenome TaxID=412755 RepID=X0W1X9_9ZZZZ